MVKHHFSFHYILWAWLIVFEPSMFLQCDTESKTCPKVFTEDQEVKINNKDSIFVVLYICPFSD